MQTDSPKTRNKPPAFQFYADDFIGGTVDLSAEDVGAYIRLLCYQWGRGKIPDDQSAINRVAGCAVSQPVLDKFPTGKNARLESEREKQVAYRELQAQKGKASAAARLRLGSTVVQPSGQPDTQPKVNSPSPSPVSNPNSNKKDATASSASKVGFQKPSLESVKLAVEKTGLPPIEAEKFFNHYESNGWRVGKNPMKSWTSALANWKINYQNYGSNTRTNSPQTPSRNEGTYNTGQTDYLSKVRRVAST